MITFFKRHLSLPLLARDMTQQSGRKMTYILRVVLVLGLMFVSWMVTTSYITTNMSGIGAFRNLGIGGTLFYQHISYLFWGIYLLVPFLCCGAIAQEKENDSLQLLMLTRLSPTAIILEKYLSCVLPVFLYLFCSLPILAYLYSLGGISADQIVRAFYTLSLAILQVGAICILSSAYSNSSMGAFLFSLLVGFLFYFTSGILSGIIVNFFFYSIRPSMNPAILFFPPHLFYQRGAALGVNLFLLSIPTVLSIIGFLFLAQRVLVRKVLARPHNAIFTLFKGIDKFFNDWNKQYAGGMVLIDNPTELPNADPIAWKEVRKTAIGTARYLVRVLLVLEFPTLFICTLISLEKKSDTDFHWVMNNFLMTIAALIIISKTTGLISSERSRQTLDVVLTIPIRGRDILLQKLKGVNRLWIVVMVPVFTTVLFRSFLVSNGNSIPYFVLSVLFTAGTLYAVIWIAFYFGLKQHRHSIAVLYALGTVAVWVALPLLLTRLGLYFMNEQSLAYQGVSTSAYTPFISNFSPSTVMVKIEQLTSTTIFNATAQESFITWGLPYIALTASLAFFFRRKCLQNADELLGRLSSLEKPILTSNAAIKNKPIIPQSPRIKQQV